MSDLNNILKKYAVGESLGIKVKEKKVATNKSDVITGRVLDKTYTIHGESFDLKNSINEIIDYKQGKQPSAEIFGFSAREKVQRMGLDLDAVRKRGYSFKGKSKEEMNELGDKYLKDIISYSISNIYEPNAFKRIGQLKKNPDGTIDVVVTGDLNSVNHYIENAVGKNSNRIMEYNTNSTEKGVNRPTAINAGLVGGMAASMLGVAAISFVVPAPTTVLGMLILVGTSIAVSGSVTLGLMNLVEQTTYQFLKMSNESKKSSTVKYINTAVAINSVEIVRAEFEHLAEQAKEKTKSGDKIAVKELKIFNKYAKNCERYKKVLEKELKKLEPKVKAELEVQK